MTHEQVRAAVIVAALASVLPSAAGATQSTTSYNLAPGACTTNIAVPANNKPVMVMGTQIGLGYRGEGYVVLFRNGSAGLLQWAGTDYYAGNEQAYSFSDGSHIMWLDYSGYVDVQVAPSSHIKVCNSASSSISPAIGYLTFMY